jgi:hypothetical protein
MSKLLALLIVLVACERLPEEPVFEPISVAPTKVYAGGTITLRSAGFRGGAPVGVYADTTYLAEVLRGGDSIVVRIPPAARGSLPVRLQGPARPAITTIQVAGYASYRSITQPIGPEFDVWPRGGTVSIVTGNANAGQRDVVEMIPKTGSIRTLITGFNLGGGGPRTPGRTPDPDVVLLQPWSGTVQAWRLFPTPELVYDLPTTNTRHIAQFNDSTIFRGLHHSVEVLRMRAGAIVPTPIYQGTYEETHEVILSPAKDRATLRVNGSPTGPPVFDMVTGDTVYHVRQLFRSYGAEFSANGDTLWMIGATPARIQGPTYSIHETVVLVLDARTGQELRRARVSGSELLAMRRDPDGGRLFIAATPEFAPFESPLDLLAIDDKNLTLLGHVQAPRSLPCSSFCASAVVGLGSEGVFVVQYGQIFEFDYFQRN